MKNGLAHKNVSSPALLSDNLGVWDKCCTFATDFQRVSHSAERILACWITHY